MDSCDEKLTIENVDEQIEECLAQSQGLQPSNVTSLARTVHNLQSIYEEDRRLEDVWTRIANRASALNSEQADGLAGRELANAPTSPIEGLTGQGPAAMFSTIQGGKKALPDADGGSLNSVLDRSNKQSRLPFRHSWYTVGIGLVAAMILIAFFAWPMVSYALRGSWINGPQPPMNKSTPQIQPTVNGTKQTEPKITPTVKSTDTPTPIATTSSTVTPTTNLPGINVYSGQYFTIQYPADWVITSVTTGSGYVQTVQFRPTATSSVFVTINVMYQSNLTSELLLLADADVKQGTLQSTSSVIQNGIAWTVGMVQIAGSGQAPASKLEIAYSNQGTPYRIEFGATSDTFSTYNPVFNAMFASFSPIS
jgi:hypothetical protein